MPQGRFLSSFSGGHFFTLQGPPNCYFTPNFCPAIERSFESQVITPQNPALFQKLPFIKHATLEWTPLDTECFKSRQHSNHCNIIAANCASIVTHFLLIESESVGFASWNSSEGQSFPVTISLSGRMQVIAEFGHNWRQIVSRISHFFFYFKHLSVFLKHKKDKCHKPGVLVGENVSL